MARKKGTRNANGMGSLEKKGKWYYVKYTDFDGKRKPINTYETDERKANAFRVRFMTERKLAHSIGDKKTRLQHIQVQLQREISDDRRALMDIRKVPVKDLYRRVFETEDGKRFAPNVGRKEQDSYCRYCDAFARWMDGRDPNSTLDIVTHEMAGEWLKGFVDGGRLDYHKRALTHLRVVFRCLVKMGVIFENPFDGFEYAKNIPHTTKRQLDDAEMSRLMEVLKDEPLEIRALFVLCIETGQRYGDICNLRWSSIHNKTENGNETMWLEFMPSKTKRHGNKVTEPLSIAAQNVLNEIKAKQLDGDFVLPKMAKGYSMRGGNTQMIRLLQVFEKAKINRKNAEGKTEVGMHSFRHGFVSRMAANGVPLTTVMSMVGHTREKMTEHYTHTSDEAKLRAISASTQNQNGMVKIEISKATYDLLESLRGDMGIDGFLTRVLLDEKKRSEMIYV